MKSERYRKIFVISVVIVMVGSFAGAVTIVANSVNDAEYKALDSDGASSAAEEFEVEPAYVHPKMGTGVTMKLPPEGVAPPAEPFVVDVYLTENKTEYIEELRNYTIDILYIEENRVVVEIYTSEILEIANLPFVTYMNTPVQFKLLTAETEYVVEPAYEHPKMGTGVAMKIPPEGVAPPAEPFVVDVYLTENKTEYIEELKNYTIDILYIEENRVVVEIYTSEILEIVNLPFVTYMNTPIQFKLCDEKLSEGLKCINADKQHNFSTGKGVKVAILDLYFLGYNELRGKELPENVTVMSFRDDKDLNGSESIPDEDRVHGTACAEIIHDIAPDAELYLVNFLRDYQWEKAVEYLITEGVDIVTHSCGSTIGLFDGTDEACKIINDAVFNHGILWINAAGNEAQRHWEGSFSETQGSDYPTYNVIGVGEVPTFNALYANQTDTIILTLCWNDSWNYSTQAYELWVINPNSKSALRSTEKQGGLKDHHPWDGLGFYAPATGYYHIGIKEVDATKPVNFDLYCWNHELENNEENSSLIVEATALGSIAVGAVNAEDCTTLLYYSSRGPTNDGRIKPDFVGPTHVSTDSYGSLGYPFRGTSAAAPHVAGAFALQLSNITSTQGRNNQSAYDLLIPYLEIDIPKDNSYGYGLPDFTQ